eukprot:COSAG06_NODE_11026_length_1580_cov_1.233626_1_plen_194_part_10
MLCLFLYVRVPSVPFCCWYNSPRMGGPADKSAHDALHELHTKVATHTLTELCGVKIARPRGFSVRGKRAHMFCDAIFYSQTIILSRQARDKHGKEHSKERWRFVFLQVLPAEGGVPEKCQLWLSGAPAALKGFGTVEPSKLSLAELEPALLAAEIRLLSEELAQELHVKVRKTPSFFEFSLCLSRACLGKMIVF